MERVEKPKIIISLITSDGESIIYPTEFEEHYLGIHGTWGEYQRWLADFLEDYNEVCSYYDDDECITVVIYKRE